MKKYTVVVTIHERREYTVDASSKQNAEDNYSDFDYDQTIIEETVEQVEEV